MSVIWTDEEKTLLTTIRPVLSTREVFKVFKILGYTRSMEAIQKQARKIGICFKDFGEPPLSNLTQEAKNAINKVLKEREGYISTVEVPTIETASSKAKKTKARHEVMSSILGQLVEARKEVPRIGSISSKRATEKQSLVLLLSDWHYGLQVLDTEHNQHIYNMSIASERILSIPQKVVSTFSPEALKNYDEIVLLFAGDMISGEGIFEGQAYVTETHAVQQVTYLTQMVWQVIKELRQYFSLVRIVTTRGNHGRTGGSPESNWDNMMYQMLELLVDMEGDNNITIKNRYGQFATVDIKGWKGLIRHHAPAQADTAAGIAKFASWHMIHEWDWFGYGHWHHWGLMTVCGKPIFRNSSLVGGDDYAESLAKHDDPAQLCWGVTKEEVCTFIKVIRF